MGATSADLIAGTRAAVIVERADAAVLTAWPDARDQKPSPTFGAFDASADATAALVVKAALIGTARRRFVVAAADMIFIDPATTGVPSMRVVDAECGVDATCLLARVEVDLNDETTTFEVIG